MGRAPAATRPARRARQAILPRLLVQRRNVALDRTGATGRYVLAAHRSARPALCIRTESVDTRAMAVQPIRIPPSHVAWAGPAR
jgi:hypothetical protein